MQEGDVRCFNCEAPCSNALGNYAPCDVCGVNPLCVACSITFDIAVCRLCADQQNLVAAEKEKEVAALNPCTTCKNVWSTQRCTSCDKYWCDACFKKVGMHLCFKCVRCGVHTDLRCCGRRWCSDCLGNHHKKTDCRITCCYRCPTCTDAVLQFGDPQFRCAIPTCQWKYACQHGGCGANIRSKEGLAYCQYHCSRQACNGCGARYGLNGLQGPVRILILMGHGNPYQVYCGNCRERCRALVESMRLMCRRAGLSLPKVMVDKVLFTYMYAKWEQWRLESVAKGTRMHAFAWWVV